MMNRIGLKAPTRRVARRALQSTMIDAGLSALASALERATRPGPYAIPVLTYHRVDDPARRPDLYPGLISATPEAFEAQVRHLVSRHEVLALPDLVDLVHDRRRPPARSVVLTFDDAYRDLLDVAWPILRAHRSSATVFVPTAFPGGQHGFWWDRLWAALATRAGDAPRPIDTPAGPILVGGDPTEAFRSARARLKSEPHASVIAAVDVVCSELGMPEGGRAVLDWDELRGLAADGLAVAPHTRTHPLLTRIPDDDLVGELRGSLEDLRSELGSALPVLAYPSGDHDARVVDATRAAGFELAFTTERGGNDIRALDPLRIRRINVGGASTLAAIRLQITLLGGRPPTRAATA